MANRKPAVANTGQFEQLQTADALDLANSSAIGFKTAQFNAEVALGNLGATETIDWTAGAFQNGTLDQNCTITISSFPGVGRYQLRLTNNGTFTVTWAGAAYSATRWIGATSAPSVNTATSGETIVTFYYDGTNATQTLGQIGVASSSTTAASTGSTTVNFGSFVAAAAYAKTGPNGGDALATITGQSGIVSGSNVSAWVMPVITADHSVDEQAIENISVVAYNIVAGTGFDVRAQCTLGGIYGLVNIGWRWQ